MPTITAETGPLVCLRPEKFENVHTFITFISLKIYTDPQKYGGNWLDAGVCVVCGGCVQLTTTSFGFAQKN